jgi:hypothetical protein
MIRRRSKTLANQTMVVQGSAPRRVAQPDGKHTFNTTTLASYTLTSIPDCITVMEVLVAVGLAGNVVQFVQGASALISLAYETKDNGTPQEIPKLIKLSLTLTGYAAVLRSRLKASSATLVEENQVRHDIIQNDRDQPSNSSTYRTSLTLPPSAKKQEISSSLTLVL